MQERRNSIANALELHLSCSNPIEMGWKKNKMYTQHANDILLEK